MALSVRRLRFRGYFTPKACWAITTLVRLCVNATHVSLPWYIIHYANELILESALGLSRARPLSSLELFTELPDKQDGALTLCSPQNRLNLNLSMLRRLKIRSNTNVAPLRDQDLAMIAKSARLEEFYVVGLSTTAMRGNYF